METSCFGLSVSTSLTLCIFLAVDLFPSAEGGRFSDNELARQIYIYISVCEWVGVGGCAYTHINKMWH